MKNCSKGYTVAELLIVIIVIGLLSSIVGLGVHKVLLVGRETAAFGKARMLNAARESYGLTVPGAATIWTGTAESSARVQLLISAGCLSGDASSYLTPATSWTIEVPGNLRDRSVTKHDGVVQAYTD